MKISTKTRYGVQAMIYLAQKGKTCSLKEIAQQENLSFPYLEKIFSALKESGLVQVKRGAQGGYSLSQPPEKISIAQIFVALEGDTDIISCEKSGHECNKQDSCLTKPFWEKLQQVFQKQLSSTKLSDILNQ